LCDFKKVGFLIYHCRQNKYTSDLNTMENAEWELTVKTMSGKFTVHLAPTACVLDLKSAIEETQGVPIDFQRLMFNSKLLTENEQPLTTYGVENNSQITLVLRMCGA
jgi:hypothetical protein